MMDLNIDEVKNLLSSNIIPITPQKEYLIFRMVFKQKYTRILIIK